jgi:aminopeptidase N
MRTRKLLATGSVALLFMLVPVSRSQASSKAEPDPAQSDPTDQSRQQDDGRSDEGRPAVQGSSGLNDPFFPFAGNGGYDVRDYDLKLAWDPTTGVLTGDVTIEAKTLQSLSRFNLDLRGFTVSRVTVNERPATFIRDGQELIVTPKSPIKGREDLEINVRYQGKPETVIDPDGAVDGWIPTADGAIALSEPQGSPSWFPVNDYPTDKATMTMSMTVPNGLVVLGNGLPEDPERRGPNTTFVWRERRPMAPYLATIAIGQYTVTRGRTSAGIPIINGVGATLAAASQPSIDRIGEILDWETTLLGRYPYESVGAIVVDAPDVGYALETQTRPVFTYEVDDSTMVHELAHQWLGNSVTLKTWPDIWLHEGFATYFEWLWSEREGGDTPGQIADAAYNRRPATAAFWTVAPAALPDPTQLFTQPAYLRGAMTLQALRTEVGDEAFFRILRIWAQSNRDGNVSTADFITLAQRVSGKNLVALFNQWLFVPAKPPTSPAPQATAATSPGARSTTAPAAEPHLDRRAKPVAGE